MHADFIGYSNIKDLTDSADAIVIGEVVNVNPPILITHGKFDDGSPWEDVFTVSDVEVKKVLKGSLKPGQMIQVKQWGGEYQGTRYIVDGESEFFSKNMRGIFFIQMYKDVPASCLNPYQGFVKIVDGKIEPFPENDLLPKGLSENEFLTNFSKEQ